MKTHLCHSTLTMNSVQNGSRTNLLRTAGLAVLLSLATMIAALPAQAQTRISDIDNPARNPFQAHCYQEFSGSDVTCNMTTVPAGYRLVIESVTGAFGWYAHTRTFPVNDVTLATTANGVTVKHHLLATLTNVFSGSSVSSWVWQFTHDSRFYADPATPVTIHFFSTGGGNCDFTISGYLVQLP